ncbi:MAG TPA: BTAD domain-containing putative transcriptional regulator [Candidatus Sulfotelmatobacter sp.]|nr:BTAD domain-containing putative transcriptional regulator [Candidatus Sulfotelmatobacter sp.]
MSPRPVVIDCRGMTSPAAVQDAVANAADASFITLDAAEVLLTMPGGEAALNAAIAAAAQRAVIAVTSRTPSELALRDVPPHDVLVFGRADLGFSDEEIRALCSPGELDDEALALIRTQTHGWPVGVLFFVRLFREGSLRASLHDLTGPSFAELRAYVASEVIAAWPPDVRQLCVACAALDHPTADDLRTLTGFSPARLHSLAETNGPVIAQADEFHIMPIVATTIRELLPEEVEALRRRALESWQLAGQHLRCAEIRLALDEPAAALAHLERMELPHPGEPIPRRYLDVVRALPIELLLSSRTPFFLLLSCPVTHAHPDALAAAVTAFTERLSGDDDPGVRSGALVAAGTLQHYQCRFVDAQAILDLAARTLADEAPVEHRRVLTAVRAATAAWRGRVHDSQHELADAGIPADGPTYFENERFEIDTTRAMLAGVDAAALDRWASWEEAARTWQDDDVTALAISYAASAAWLGGDDATFAVRSAEIDALHSRGRQRDQRRRFAETTTPLAEPWTTLRLLDAALRLDDPVFARRLAAVALTTAQASGAVVWITVAAIVNAALEDDPTSFLTLAKQAAAAIDDAAFRAGVDALAAGRANRTGPLAPLVRRMRQSKATRLDVVRVDVFAGVALRHGRPLPVRDREIELLAALSLAGGSIDREVLAERLWDAVDPQAAQAALRASTHRLRRDVGDREVVQVTGNAYRLTWRVVTDFVEAETVVAGLRRLGDLTDSDRAWLRRWLGKLTAPTSPAYLRWRWFVTYEPRVVELRHHVAMLIAEDLLRSGDPEGAVNVAETLLYGDPLDEPANELAIRAKFAGHHPAEGLRRFRLYRDMLQREYQAVPPDALARLAMGRPEPPGT